MFYESQIGFLLFKKMYIKSMFWRINVSACPQFRDLCPQSLPQARGAKNKLFQLNYCVIKIGVLLLTTGVI